MRILVLGINHQIQPRQIKSWGSGGEPQQFEREQKEFFCDLLRTRMAERTVDLVAEEAAHTEESLAHAVCQQQGCRHVNIEIHPDERSARCIPPDYERNETISPEAKADFHRQREDFMIEKTLAEADTAKSALVICGRFHSDALSRRFREAGHDVETADVQDEPWYVEDWMERMMRM